MAKVIYERHDVNGKGQDDDAEKLIKAITMFPYAFNGLSISLKCIMYAYEFH